MLRASLGLFSCLLITLHCFAAENPERAAVLPRLVEQLSALQKDGNRTKVWVDVFGKRSECEVSAADTKSLTVLVQGNPLPLAWEKMSDDEIMGVAKSAAAETGPGILLAAEVALALKFDDQAGDLLTKASLADPQLADKIAALAARIPNKVSVAPAAKISAASVERPVQDTRTAITTRLPMGWWKGYRAPDVPVSRIHAGRPRIFLREAAFGTGGVSLEELRARGSQEPWKSWVPRFTKDISCNAMKFLLTGDRAAADDAVKQLLQKPDLGGDTDDGDELERRCMAYDWLHGYAGFSPDQKKKSAEIIAATADVLIKRLKNDGPHIFHTRMHAWANGLVFAGLALAGDHSRAEEFLSFGYRYWREKLFPGRWHLDGAWANGFGYGRKFLCRSTFAFLNAWKSGTGEDLWLTIEKEQNDWARAMLMYLIYTHRPDGKYPAYGDCFYDEDEKLTCGLAMMFACGTRDPYAAGLADALHKKHGLRCVEGHWNIYPLLFWDPALAKKGPEDLPASRLFGQNGIGAVVMRGGWGPKDAFVFYKCGDYIENHGHFDQGSFEICCERPLAVDSGSYAGGMNGAHRLQYYRQSIASNTLLICDGNDRADTGNQRIIDWQDADSMDAYLAHTAAETGSIVDFRSGADFTIVVSDMTAAYASAKVRSVTRSLVFLRGMYLVVCDVVQPAAPNVSVKFLLHYPSDALIDKSRCVIDNGPSRLVCDTLWPEAAKISKIPGFIVNGKNLPPADPKKEDVGAGRIEIESRDPNPVLLHVLTIGSKDLAAERPKAKVDGALIQVEVGGRRITFDASGRNVSVK